MSFGPRNVLVEHMVLSRIKAIAEAAAFRHEVGGILLGSYRGRDLHVCLSSTLPLLRTATVGPRHGSGDLQPVTRPLRMQHGDGLAVW